jgi:oligopeptide transport system substrate-binding protein
MAGVRSAWLVAALAALVLLAWWLLGPAPRAPKDDAAIEFVRGNNTDPESLDPLQARSEPALNVVRDLHEGLVALDASGQAVPGAASGWRVAPNGLEWTFMLDPAARWSDGRPVLAEDFLLGFRALANPATGSPHAGLFDAIAGLAEATAGHGAPEDVGVYADDHATLRIVLARPVPWLPELLAHPAASPRRADAPADGRISSGAFRLDAKVPGSHLLLLRNPHYRAAEEVAIDRVRYLPIADPASELSRYRAGELDMTYTAPVSRIPWLGEHMADEFRVSPYLATYFYGFNTRRPPLDDVRVRRALSLAVERELITGRIVGAGELPACTLVPAAIPGYTPPRDAECEARRRDRLERAQALLAEAGYGPDRPLRLEIRYNTGEIHDRIAVAVSAMWKEALGVETSLVREEFRVLLGNVRSGDVTQVYRGSWIADYTAPESFLEILGGAHPVNGTGWADPEYDRMLQEATAHADPATRMRLLARAEARAMAAVPIMPLYFYVSKKLVKPHVRGIEDNPLNIHPSRFVRLCRPADACPAYAKPGGLPTEATGQSSR